MYVYIYINICIVISLSIVIPKQNKNHWHSSKCAHCITAAKWWNPTQLYSFTTAISQHANNTHSNNKKRFIPIVMLSQNYNPTYIWLWLYNYNSCINYQTRILKMCILISYGETTTESIQIPSSYCMLTGTDRFACWVSIYLKQPKTSVGNWDFLYIYFYCIHTYQTIVRQHGA